MKGDRTIEEHFVDVIARSGTGERYVYQILNMARSGNVERLENIILRILASINDEKEKRQAVEIFMRIKEKYGYVKAAHLVVAGILKGGERNE